MVVIPQTAPNVQQAPRTESQEPGPQVEPENTPKQGWKKGCTVQVEEVQQALRLQPAAPQVTPRPRKMPGQLPSGTRRQEPLAVQQAPPQGVGVQLCRRTVPPMPLHPEAEASVQPVPRQQGTGQGFGEQTWPTRSVSEEPQLVKELMLHRPGVVEQQAPMRVVHCTVAQVGPAKAPAPPAHGKSELMRVQLKERSQQVCTWQALVEQVVPTPSGTLPAAEHEAAETSVHVPPCEQQA